MTWHAAVSADELREGEVLGLALGGLPVALATARWLLDHQDVALLLMYTHMNYVGLADDLISPALWEATYRVNHNNQSAAKWCAFFRVFRRAVEVQMDMLADNPDVPPSFSSAFACRMAPLTPTASALYSLDICHVLEQALQGLDPEVVIGNAWEQPSEVDLRGCWRGETRSQIVMEGIAEPELVNFESAYRTPNNIPWFYGQAPFVDARRLMSMPVVPPSQAGVQYTIHGSHMNYETDQGTHFGSLT